ncbi:MAG TPA: hypothetical protein VJT72_08110 [Pseudonocardiaceae bacterium]|nr:hypothetical protein [Pseudonocardiaceae bacterium]
MTTSLAPTQTPPAHRVVPALVNGQQIFIECRSWCSMDHVAENVRQLADAYHSSDFADLLIRSGSGKPELLLSARIGLDPYSPDPARLVPFVVIDDGSDCADLTPQQAEEFADSLVAFAAKVRDLAVTASKAVT